MSTNNKKIREEEDALNYHKYPTPGKIEVVVKKPFVSQRDLTLAYSPGVAVPSLAIEEDPLKAYEYTGKGNLVAVITNGTAVLGLGDIGALAGKPVMEGKAGLFKVFADIDVFDIELNSKNVEEVIRTVEILSPTFGGINLEDIKAPDAFYIEKALQEKLDIPVFHDDQHGTAIISGAALLNATELAGKTMDEVKVVFNGAGAASIASAHFIVSLGVKKENIIMCDSKGVIYKGRTEGMNEFKDEFAVDTPLRTLEEAFVGADVFMGLSQGDCVTGAMVKTMASSPIIFAMANPDPEITYEDAKAARPEVIMATGRSDYPNQVNNVLGFPFIFRGALDVFAKKINLEMKIAAAKALAELAKEEVPENVRRAYGGAEIVFGPDYIIPKPFDPRVLTRVAPAVAEAAMESGVARKPIADFDEYRRSLDIRMGRTQSFMSLIYKKAKLVKKKVVFPEGEEAKIIRTAQICADEGICDPILIGNEENIKLIADEFGYELDGVTIVNPKNYEKTYDYIEKYYQLRQRKGITRPEAKRRLLRFRNYFASMMVYCGDADCFIGGLTTNYPSTARPAFEIIGKSPLYKKASGLYIVSTKSDTYFLADTTVNPDPTAEEIADIAIQAARFTKYFDFIPKVALLSYSNFGSSKGESPEKMREALKIIKQRQPELEVDGEIQADAAVSPDILAQTFSFSDLKGGANVLIFPNLDAGNIAYKLLDKIGKTNIIGPILLGMNKPVHVLQMGAEVNQILDMVALAVVNAQDHQ